MSTARDEGAELDQFGRRLAGGALEVEDVLPLDVRNQVEDLLRDQQLLGQLPESGCGGSRPRRGGSASVGSTPLLVTDCYKDQRAGAAFAVAAWLARSRIRSRSALVDHDPVGGPRPSQDPVVVEAVDELASEADLDPRLLVVDDLPSVDPDCRLLCPLRRSHFDPGEAPQLLDQRVVHAGSRKPPSTTRTWPRIISASGEQRKTTAFAMSVGRDEPARGRALLAPLEHLLLLREVLERLGVDDPARDGVHPDPARRELDREVADERLERGLRRARRARSP